MFVNVLGRCLQVFKKKFTNAFLMLQVKLNVKHYCKLQYICKYQRHVKNRVDSIPVLLNFHNHYHESTHFIKGEFSLIYIVLQTTYSRHSVNFYILKRLAKAGLGIRSFALSLLALLLPSLFKKRVTEQFPPVSLFVKSDLR